jgi:hypothetical protein
MCPHTTISVSVSSYYGYVSSYYYIYFLREMSFSVYICTHTRDAVLLYMCPHTVSSCYYICVLILVCMCDVLVYVCPNTSMHVCCVRAAQVPTGNFGDILAGYYAKQVTNLSYY